MERLKEKTVFSSRSEKEDIWTGFSQEELTFLRQGSAKGPDEFRERVLMLIENHNGEGAVKRLEVYGIKWMQLSVKPDGVRICTHASCD